jgi:hypothetical protein
MSAMKKSAESVSTGMTIPNATTSPFILLSSSPTTGKPSRLRLATDSAMKKRTPAKTIAAAASMPHQRALMSCAALLCGWSTD